MSKENSISKFEKCIMCGEQTNISVSTPISCRKDYIYGCGQLCSRCISILNKENNLNRTIVTSGEVNYLLYMLGKNNEEETK